MAADLVNVNKKTAVISKITAVRKSYQLVFCLKCKYAQNTFIKL